MFWLTQCSVQAQCQYSSKLFIKLIAEACDPLASVTTAAKTESNKYQRRSNVLFPLLLSVIPCFQLIVLEQVMVPKEKTKAFSLICSKVQPSKENGKNVCAETIGEVCENAPLYKRMVAGQGLEKIPYSRGSGSEEPILGASRKGGPPQTQTQWNGRNPSLFPGRAWGRGRGPG